MSRESRDPQVQKPSAVIPEDRETMLKTVHRNVDGMALLLQFQMQLLGEIRRSLKTLKVDK
ncbi:hypothetical protein SH661x_001515 [Planctomicrobium sp. SH661]|uniref:hypothetical protein n=1 Tax=Planctomicrobium sp. SH661 TaxID=3448124 RepID=UPI003F5C4E9B